MSSTLTAHTMFKHNIGTEMHLSLSLSLFLIHTDTMQCWRLSTLYSLEPAGAAHLICYCSIFKRDLLSSETAVTYSRSVSPRERGLY